MLKAWNVLIETSLLEKCMGLTPEEHISYLYLNNPESILVQVEREMTVEEEIDSWKTFKKEHGMDKKCKSKDKVKDKKMMDEDDMMFGRKGKSGKGKMKSKMK